MGTSVRLTVQITDCAWNGSSLKSFCRFSLESSFLRSPFLTLRLMSRQTESRRDWLTKLTPSRPMA